MADYDPVLDTDKLWRLMRKHSYTPQSLASEMGVSLRTVGSWLTGAVQPRPIALIYMALIFHLPSPIDLQKQRPSNE